MQVVAAEVDLKIPAILSDFPSREERSVQLHRENLLWGQKPNPDSGPAGSDPDFKELQRRVLNLQIPWRPDQPVCGERV